MERKILVINPGATSTKISVFNESAPILSQIVEHSADDLAAYGTLLEQLPYRKGLIQGALDEAGIDVKALSAVVGRGGLLAPMPGGVYGVCPELISDLSQARYGEHASNLGAILANEFAAIAGCPSFIVDPVSTDEFEPPSRISGLPELPRISKFHALNHKAVARKAAAELGLTYDRARLVVCHLGTGVSTAAHKMGRVVDICDPMNEGTFSADRTGHLPTLGLIELCYSGKYSKAEMKRKANGEGGYFAYIGTKDLREAWDLVDEGNETACLVMEAFVRQVSKDIGAMTTVLCGKLDAIVFTGGMAHSERLLAALAEHVGFIAPILVFPGEEEMTSLALGALRVLDGEEEAKIYSHCG